jgi:hypothetical protein
MLKTKSNCTPKPMLAEISYRAQSGNRRAGGLQDFPRGIRTPVVHDDDFVRNLVEPQFNVQVLDGRTDTLGFVPRRNDDGQLLERR